MCSDDVAHAPLEIECVCHESKYKYDGLGFATFPDRVGVDTMALRNGSLSNMPVEYSAPFCKLGYGLAYWKRLLASG